MTNSTLGYGTIFSAITAIVCYYMGSFTEVMTQWDYFGNLMSWIFTFLSLWCAVRLIRLK